MFLGTFLDAGWTSLSNEIDLDRLNLKIDTLKNQYNTRKK
jgi:hypothetical protein